jgi:hypothetical protein
VRRRIQLAGFGVGALLAIWYKAVLNVGAVKERKAARRAARRA